MVKIILNENTFCEEDRSAALARLGALVNEIEQKKLIVRSFKIDDVETEFAIEGSIDACQDAELVDLKVCPLPELLREALDDAQEYLPRLSRGLRRVAEFFITGREGEGINIFLQALDGLQWFEQFSDTLAAGVSDLPGDLAGRLSRHRGSLADLLAAWENRDYLLIGDILEYELAPYLEYFIEHLPALKEMLNNGG